MLRLWKTTLTQVQEQVEGFPPGPHCVLQTPKAPVRCEIM